MKKKTLLLLMAVASLVLSGCATIRSGYEAAHEINTVESYEEFLAKHPDSEYEQEVRKRIEKLEWQNAKSLKTLDSYQNYLRMYPSGRFKTQAEAGIKKLHWEAAKKEHSIESYEEFLVKHPNSEYQQEIKKRIEKLEWQNAKSLNTLDSYQNYLRMYPSGSFKTEAEAEIEKLHWEAAKKEHSIASYRGYLSEYPTGNFAEEAQERILYINKKKKFFTKLLKADDEDIKHLLDHYSEYDFANNAIPLLEDWIINKIKNEGINNRFIIRKIKPRSTVFSGYRTTLKEESSQFHSGTDIYTIPEFPTDPKSWNLPSSVSLSFGAKGVPRELFYSSKVIHRYQGKITREDDYIFIGEGNKYNRLTFVLLDQGYVYVRGKGKVVMPNGEIVKLGY